MNRFTRLIAGRSWCAALVALVASSAVAQRVQFPTPAQPVQATIPAAPTPYAVPASPYAVTTPPAFSAPVTSAPTVTSPFMAAPAPATSFPAAPPSFAPAPYSAPAVGPPPAFDAYAVGNSVTAPPPPAMPYSYTPPPVAPPPAAPNSLYPNGMPYQYQQPAPYGAPTTPGEGYWDKTQRFLQELSVEGTYLYGKQSDPNDLAWTRAEASSTFAIPLWGQIETPLLVTPGFAFNWLQGPATNGMNGEPDLPAQVYDAYLDFAWYPRVTPYLGGELGFRTGVWSDFSFWDTDSIRFLGRGLANVSLTPQLDILFGIVYLDRLNVKLLPAGGVYYRPSPEWDIYAVFPNPKIRNFISAVGNTKWWWYAAGEYGGGTWTVRRQFVSEDQFDYNDIRVSGGVEFETQAKIRGHLEVGYVFDRELLFRSGDPGSFNLDDTFMFRGGVDF